MTTMNSLKIMLITCALTLPAMASEEMVLIVAQRADQVMGLAELGTLTVEGTGRVKLTASRTGTQLVLQVIGPDDKVLGRAESVVGLPETPIYVTTPKGLQKLTVKWNGP